MSLTFGSRSTDALLTCHADLSRLAKSVLEVTPIDFSVLCGHRTAIEQKQLFSEGRSKLDGVMKLSKHQEYPSQAMDIAPYPIDWDGPYARYRFYWLSGAVMGVARKLDIPVRWGGDWDCDGSFADQSFHDLPHFELLGI